MRACASSCIPTSPPRPPTGTGPRCASSSPSLWEDVADRGRCDFVRDFAKPYPARMIATVVGAPLEDAAELHRLSNLLQSQFDAIALMTRREELEQAAAEFDAYVRRLVDERRSSPGDDLVSAMIAAEEEGDRLSDEECVSLVRDALNGGIDTTQSALAHGVRLFAGHPDQWAALGADDRRSRRRPPRRCCASSPSRPSRRA